MLLLVSSARASIVTVSGQEYGVQRHADAAELFSDNPLSTVDYGAGPILQFNDTYAIYWDPAVLRAGDPGRPGKYHGNWQQQINRFLHDVAAASNQGELGNVYALTGQYTETGGSPAAYKSTFEGGYVDHDTYPANGCTDPEQSTNKNFACFTDQQLHQELLSFIEADHLPTGLSVIYFLLTPPGVTVCTDGGTITGHCSDSGASTASYENSFCSYHSYTTSPALGTVLYSVIPWTTGTLGSALEPAGVSGSDCQNGTTTPQEPNQGTFYAGGLSPDGFYDNGLPDVLINQISEEQIATITDPTFTAWNEPVSGDEVPDLCRNWFEGPPVVQGIATAQEHTEAGTLYNQTINGDNYYLNTEFNQAADYYDYPGLRCELHNNLVPSFTTPAGVVNAGVNVSFDGNQSDVTLEQSADDSSGSQPYHRAQFSWSFGDGSTVSGPGYSSEGTPLYASVFHSYTYGGTYNVTLTVTDAAGNTASVSEPITVEGPAAPSPSGGAPGSGGSQTTAPAAAVGSSSSGSSGSGSSGSSSSGSGSSGGTFPGPVASQAVLSHSLSSVLSKGLLIRYSVNEQVAGRFEVLLAASIAKRIGLHGPPATGLVNGTPPQIVIGKAILVTTKGGRSTVKIQFGKVTAARLRKLRKVSLMLMLVVRNASSHSPLSTTVLSTITLSH
jgi:PKD domain